MFVTALLLCAAWWLQLRPRLAVWLPTVALLFAGLLWTHSRSSYLALALGLVVFAIAAAAVRGVALAGAAVARGRRRARLREGLPAHRAPTRRASRAARELPPMPAQLTLASAAAGAGRGASASSGLEDASTASHCRSLRDGIETVLRHPQGYGPGNAGSTAARTDVTIKAGESTYTELGVDAGLVGGLLFVAWSLRRARAAVPLHRLARRRDGRDARARAADRHHRRALGRLRPLAARRLAHVPPEV